MLYLSPSCSQNHQHFTSSFCAHFLSPKNYNTVCKQVKAGQNNFVQATGKMLMKLTPDYPFIVNFVSKKRNPFTRKFFIYVFRPLFICNILLKILQTTFFRYLWYGKNELIFHLKTSKKCHIIERA